MKYIKVGNIVKYRICRDCTTNIAPCDKRQKWCKNCKRKRNRKLRMERYYFVGNCKKCDKKITQGSRGLCHQCSLKEYPRGFGVKT